MSYQLYDHLQMPIIVLSKSYEIVYFNFICSPFFGLPPRKLKKCNDLSELFGNSNTKVLKLVESLSELAPTVSEEILIQTPKQDYTVVFKLFLEKNNVVMQIQDFSIERLLHEKYKQQIIELKNTHEQIVKSDKLRALGELIAGISHEISSPLMVATDLAYELEEMIHQHKIDPSKKAVTNLQDEIARIKQIVSNMQSMSKAEAKDVEVFSLKTAVDKAISFLNDLSLLDNISVDIKLSRSFALASQSKIEQVIINLIKNSIDAISKNEKKEIKIYSEINMHSQLIHIVDNGAGIKNTDEIFEMFYTTKEYGEGTGLGLSISQKIMEDSHGELRCEPIEQGAHFVMEFPRLDIESFTTTNEYLKGAKDYEDKKIFILGDDEGDLNELFQKLKGENVVLILCDNFEGFEALKDAYLADESYRLQSNQTSLSGASVKTVSEIIKTIRNENK